MFIYLIYKDCPELTPVRRRSSTLDTDLSIEKYLLVNPNCYVRIMLEYIRKTCKLAATTQFDLCEESGILKGLFSYPTFAYVVNLFEHKKTYYLVVLKPEYDKTIIPIPQLNHDNKLFYELQAKIQNSLINGSTEPQSSSNTKSASQTTKSVASQAKTTVPTTKSVATSTKK